jgi:hypothetical protein
MDDKPVIKMTREDLEGLLGEKIMDWQWGWVEDVLLNKKRTLRMSKEELFTNRPNLIHVITEEMRQNWLNSIQTDNNAAYVKEVEAAQSILRRNRYSTVAPFEWYGPDPEPLSVKHGDPKGKFYSGEAND